MYNSQGELSGFPRTIYFSLKNDPYDIFSQFFAK